MVTRYPKEHDAEVVYDSTGHLEHGEWIPGVHKTVHLHGRFDHSNSSRHVLKKNANGDLLEVYGEYYTRRQLDGETAHAHCRTLRIPGLGIERPIIAWENYQTHSVIYV